MAQADDDELLKAVALRNASSILRARNRVEDELIQARDALERKTQELARSLAMMKATLDSATDGILVTDEEGRVTGGNQKFQQMWQIPDEAMQPGDHRRLLDPISAFFDDPSAFRARVEEIYRLAPPTTFDLLLLKDGRLIERQSCPQTVEGVMVGRVWSFRDISEQRRAAEERKQLLESERAARNLAEHVGDLKDQFLATLSHELRTPLSAIVGWVHILRRSGDKPMDLRKGLDTIERNSRLQIQLIEDLLDMNRIASGKVRLDMQPVEPTLFIEAALETVRPAAEAKGVRLSCRLDSSVGTIPGDPARLQQVMGNLLSNALKFTPAGGAVEIMLQRSANHVEITVTDSGIGIHPDFVAHVFERFRQADASTTRRYGGLGLGLSIVRHLVELHDGTISVASAGEGRGASFTVCLPLAPGRAREVGPPAPPVVRLAPAYAPVDLSGLKVLVVDDDPDGLELAVRVLRECRAEVLTAAGAAQALELVERQRPDVLVSDIGMPDVDGFMLLRQLRERGAARGGSVPAIALTSFARPEDRTQSMEAGFVSHLTKPFDPADLADAVRSAAGRAPALQPDQGFASTTSAGSMARIRSST